MAVKSVCGAILVSTNPETLARFYGDALALSFEREDHAGLAPHWESTSAPFTSGFTLRRTSSGPRSAKGAWFWPLT